jgi:hypothetical protein
MNKPIPTRCYSAVENDWTLFSSLWLYVFNVNKQISNNNIVINSKSCKFNRNIENININNTLHLATVHFVIITKLLSDE